MSQLALPVALRRSQYRPQRRPDARFLSAAVLTLASLGELPRWVGLEGFSALSLFTGIFAFFAVVVWLAKGILPTSMASLVWPFFALLVWGVLTFAWHKPLAVSYQNLLILFTFAALLLAFGSASYSDFGLPWFAGRWLARITIVSGAAVVLLSVLGRGGGGIFNGRSFALFALLGISWFLAGWATGSRRSLFLALSVMLIVGATLSRLALVVALALIPLAAFAPRSFRGWLRLVVGTGVVVLAAYFAATRVAPLEERFFGGESERFEIGGIGVGSTGRTVMWEITWHSFLDEPWIGKGAGSSSEVLAPQWEHPHNDYLRILHDYGIVGLSLWLLGIARLLRALWRRRVLSNDRRDEQVYLAGFLATVAVSMTMVANNPWVYPFVMAPLGVLIGISLGPSSRINGFRVRSGSRVPVHQRAESQPPQAQPVSSQATRLEGPWRRR